MMKTKAPANVVKSIKARSVQLASISEKVDVEAFDQALHDDWFMIDANGAVVTKKEELALLRSSNFKPSSLKVANLEVQVQGDTAIVTGVSTVKAKFKGKDISGRYRFTQVYKAAGENLAKAKGAALPSNFMMVTCIAFAL